MIARKNINASFNKLAVGESSKGKTCSLLNLGGKLTVLVLADDRFRSNTNNDSLRVFSALFRVPDKMNSVVSRITRDNFLSTFAKPCRDRTTH